MFQLHEQFDLLYLELIQHYELQFLKEFPLMVMYFKYLMDNQIKNLSLIHISEPTRPLYISYPGFC